MARKMFPFQSAWWNLPSWLQTHWKGCAVPWAHCLFPSLSSTFHCEKHHEQHEGYRTPHSGSLGTGLMNFDPVQAYPKVCSWHGAHPLKLEQVSSHSSHSLLLQTLPSSLLLLYVQERQKSGTLSSPYLVQGTSPQSPFALAAALDWRTPQMTEQSKVLLSTQKAVVPWSRVQFQMWWGMKAWLHHKPLLGNFAVWKHGSEHVSNILAWVVGEMGHHRLQCPKNFCLVLLLGQSELWHWYCVRPMHSLLWFTWLWS